MGLACRFPGGDGPEAYWRTIREGRVATGPVSPRRWRHHHLHRPDEPRAADYAYTDVVAHLADVETFQDAGYGLAPRRLEVTDPQHRLLLTLTGTVLRGREAGDPERTGVYVGASVSEYKDLLTSRVRASQMAAGDFGEALDPEVARAAVSGVVPMRAFTMAGALLNLTAATISSAFDLRGPSLVVDAACASSLLAVHEAIGHLRTGQVDLAVAGGVYLNLVPDNLVAFSRIGALSRAGVCRPFDRRADGFVLGEGAGVVLLKRHDDALRDGDPVYGVILGSGCANDGRADGPMTPRLEGQVAALRRAYEDAGVDPSTVGFVECHGTGTPAGDRVELAALREVFGGGAHVSSVKANIGHTLPASGIASLVKALLVLRHREIPPQPERVEPVAGLHGFRVAERPEPWAGPRRAAVNSFGFGGTNVHLVLDEGSADAAPPRAAPSGGRRFWAVTPGRDPHPGPRRSPGGLLEAVAAASDHPVEALRPDHALVADLGFDSLMLLELEEKLGLERLPPDLVQRTTTIGDLQAWVAARDEAPADPWPEVAAFAERRALPQRLGLPNPYFVAHEAALGATTTVDGVELVDFSGYDYLGLATDPRVVGAAQEAVARYGTSVSASRLISGERPPHRELETEIAALLGAEDALAMVSGYATNVAVLGHLLAPGDLALHDAYAHDSIVQGVRLSGATRRAFPHNDLAALDRLLKDQAGRHRRVVVAVEGVYSMDGDLADLPALADLRRRYGFLLYVDEAHSVGVLGRTGRGAGEHWSVSPSDVDIWMGTLSKALASCGGYVAASAAVIDYLRYTTPGFLFSVGLPPAATAAALAAVRVLTAEPERVDRLRANTAHFRAAAAARGIDTGGGTAPVVPVLAGGSVEALRLSERMRRRGVNVQPIVAPAVPDETARLRFFVNATHTAEQLDLAVEALRLSLDR